MEAGTIIIPPYAFKRLRLENAAAIVYGIIYGFSISKGNQGKFFGSLKYISDLTGLQRTYVCNILKTLVEKGYIKKTVISATRIEYTIVPPDELKLDDKTAVNASNLTPKCETQSGVSNPITEENKSICDEMDAINDKPPNIAAEEKENAEKRLAAIRARLAAKIENEK